MPFETLFPFFLVLAFIAVALSYSLWRKNRFGETLRSVALDLGCRYDPGGWMSQPEMEGEYRGRKVAVGGLVVRYGKHSKTFTTISVWHKGHVREEMVLEPENLGTRLSKLFGAADVQVGNPEFDAKYRVGAKDRMQAMSLLDPEMRQKLLESGVKVEILPDRVYYQHDGYIFDKGRVIKLVNLLADIAERVGGA